MSNNLKLEPEKLYYVKKQNGEICIRKTYLYSSIKTERYVLFVDFDDQDIIEVISPVPSYDELQALKEENANLKELLKECKEHLCHHYCQMTVGKLEKKIEEILK